MNHYKDCSCDRCRQANTAIARLKGPRTMPRHVLEEYKEKRARQEFMEYSSGLMEIQCPHCRHYSKVKVGPVMHCPKCARQW